MTRLGVGRREGGGERNLDGSGVPRFDTGESRFVKNRIKLYIFFDVWKKTKIDEGKFISYQASSNRHCQRETMW